MIVCRSLKVFAYMRTHLTSANDKNANIGDAVRLREINALRHKNLAAKLISWLTIA